MTKIRLARFGSRHQPHYRIVVADSRSRRDGRFIESLGSYNPQAGTVQLNVERAEYWISVGAQPTNTTLTPLTMLNMPLPTLAQLWARLIRSSNTKIKPLKNPAKMAGFFNFR